MNLRQWWSTHRRISFLLGALDVAARKLACRARRARHRKEYNTRGRTSLAISLQILVKLGGLAINRLVTNAG